MKFNIEQIFTWQNLMNIIDILIVWYIIYRLIMLVRGTKAVQLVKGISLIILVRIVAGLLHLHTLTYFVDQILSWSVIGIIVIFQPEIRRGLEHLGRSPIFGGTTMTEKQAAEKMIGELDKAIQYMSKRRIGALITIQQNTGLEDYIETGIPIDADITGELLINIFIPNTPLHDGAVIIRNNRIAVAAAYLPLSDNSMIPKKLGTRHRAAVGISEVTDAITIVVSEETGGVTITRNSQFMLDLTREEYLKYLNAQLVPKEEEEKISSNVFAEYVSKDTSDGLQIALAKSAYSLLLYKLKGIYQKILEESFDDAVVNKDIAYYFAKMASNEGVTNYKVITDWVNLIFQYKLNIYLYFFQIRFYDAYLIFHPSFQLNLYNNLRHLLMLFLP